jgi:hypothetical protein
MEGNMDLTGDIPIDYSILEKYRKGHLVPLEEEETVNEFHDLHTNLINVRADPQLVTKNGACCLEHRLWARTTKYGLIMLDF